MSQDNDCELGWRTQPGYLPDTLWRSAPRSRELSAHMVQRYRGRHAGTIATWHAGWELVLIMRGKGLLYAGEVLPLTSDTAYLIPPRCAHRETSEGDIDTLWVGLEGTCIAHLPHAIQRLTGARALHPLARQLWLCAERRPAPVGPELDGLARMLVAQALRLADDVSSPAPLQLDTCIEYLHRHLARPLVVGELARRCGCSERHLNRLFRAHTGLAPSHYLRRIRIDQARKLMAYQQLSLAEIAGMVGYPDPAYFSRVFRSETGFAPSTVAAH